MKVYIQFYASTNAKDLKLSIQIIVICRTFQKLMISPKSLQHQSTLFATPPPKKRVQPRSIMRKPSLVSFTKKKQSQIAEIRSSDRIRFISPTRANLTITEDMLDPQTSIDFNYTQYPSNQQINYPFIRKCTSPKHYNHQTISRKSSFCPDSLKQDSLFLNTFLQPSIQDFSSCQFDSSLIKNSSDQLQQEISQLKKANFELNLMLDEKNQLIEKQKQQHDARLAELTQQLMEIKNGIQMSQGKMVETEQKMLGYQYRVKELEEKLTQTNDKLDKAEKEVKMYKAKYRINFNSPKLTEDVKSKKYHQNCCKGHQNHGKILKNTQSNVLSKDLNLHKPGILKQSKKKPSSQVQGPCLKKIKSQTLLPLCNQTSSQCSPQASRLMKIHSNQEQFNEYISMKIHIQNLAKQIRYKDIQILTLKKTKSEFEKEKQNFQKVRKFNKKLLARVEFLTRECDEGGKGQNRKRLSLPMHMTPKKFKVQYEDFDSDSDQDPVSEYVQFQLSPQKHYQKGNLDTTDTVFEIDDLS